DSYIAAWRHIHDIFTAAGATNVQWVWCPNAEPDGSLPLEALYPGDAYVDWLGLDGFNRVAEGWASFSTIFGTSYRRLTAMTSKPVIIAETSSSEALPGMGVSKAQWIESALTQEIPTSFPRVEVLIWYNDDKSGVEAN